MKDLKSQLQERLGSLPLPATATATATATASAPAAPARPPKVEPKVEDSGALAPNAHLVSPWLVKLRAVRLPGHSVAASPSLGNARQVTDLAVKGLKKAGRPGEARELDDLRDRFMDKRATEAWSLIKQTFTTFDLPDRAYRALKQSDLDPVTVLTRLRALPEDELRGMGADRLRDRLSAPRG